MSIYRPQELRYSKLDAVKEERALMNNYYQDIIRQYGVDLTYFRRDTDFKAPDGSGISSELIYGHKNKPTYSKHTDIRGFIDNGALDYSFLLNMEGFVPNDKFTFYFGINDFAVSFVEDLGQFQNFKIDEEEGIAYLLQGRNYVTVKFNSEIMSGSVKFLVDRGVKKTKVDTEITRATIPCYSVAFNPYIYRSFSTDYRDGYYSANIYVDYDSTRGNNVRYKIYGDILYSNFFENDRVISEIHPNPGDVIQLDYHTNDMASEQYEITEVISRKPTSSDGLSPFLGKYVWRCTAVRRIESGEDLPKETNLDESNNKKSNFEADRNADTDKKNFDWSSDDASTDSNVYGNYSKSDDFKKPVGLSSLEVDKIFDTNQLRENWNDVTTVRTSTYVIANFTDGSQLYTNGYNLFWKHKDLTETKITDFDETTVKKPDKIPEMMYIRVLNGQLVFTTINNTNIVLTKFENTKQDEFGFYDGFLFRDVGYVSNDGYYIFRNERVAINSFNDKELVVFSGKQKAKEVIAENE